MLVEAGLYLRLAARRVGICQCGQSKVMDMLLHCDFIYRWQSGGRNLISGGDIADIFVDVCQTLSIYSLDYFATPH